MYSTIPKRSLKWRATRRRGKQASFTLDHIWLVQVQGVQFANITQYTQHESKPARKPFDLSTDDRRTFNQVSNQNGRDVVHPSLSCEIHVHI